MKLLRLLREGSSVSLLQMVAVAALAGTSSALVLAIINAAAGRATNSNAALWYLLLFAAVIALYVVAQRWVMIVSSQQMERVLHKIRVRITDKVRHSDLQTFEHIGRAEIYASIHKNTQTLSQAWLNVVDGAQSALLVFFTTLYIAWLSVPAFILTVIFVYLAVAIYFQRRRQLTDALNTAAAQENRLFETVTGLLDGFKAVRINSARSEELFAHVNEISSDAMELKVRTRNRIASQFIFSQVTFYLLLATMVFVVPRFSSTYNSVVIKTTTAILFLIGPVGSLVGSIPTLAEANAAAERIDRLEARLDASAYRAPQPEKARNAFSSIQLAGASFHYADVAGAATFRVGPLDLTVRAGETVFIAGGNGSGKSTLLKLLTGLYHPDRGELLLDGTPVGDEDREAYYSLFAVIFSDFHLFRRLYGIRAVAPERLAELLALLELEGKTGLHDREFSTLDLSGGQRKRLALLVSFLEDKPIFVFDEWAADQDPAFRRKFYQELLPELRRSGKTVIAVTHDDTYFGAADRLLVMRDGQLVEEGAA
jgi:putative pyoverdin transport system ATP-binding/permease protein